MKIDIIAEHSVCLELLPEKARILDAGCRDFLLTNYFRNLYHQVTAIDIGALYGGEYLRYGLSDRRRECYITNDQDPQAQKLCDGEGGHNRITALPLSEFEKMAGGKFDLIKLDIEGEELPVLSTAKHPIARQVSVEFHIHCGQKLEDVNALLLMLGEYYEIHGAVLEERHGAGMNYWDVLMIAK